MAHLLQRLPDRNEFGDKRETVQGTALFLESQGMSEETEEFIREHGEQWRLLIKSALRFLDEHESAWNLDRPIGRKTYIRELVREAKRSAK